MSKKPVLSLLVALSLSGCASPSPTTPGTIAADAENALLTPETSGRASGPTTISPSTPAGSASPSAMATPGAVAAEDAAGAPAPAFAPGEPTPGTKTTVEPEQQEPLKAGAVDDNAKFSDFMDYVSGYKGFQMRNLDVSKRFVVQVTDASGKAVSNADVTVTAGEEALMTAKSYANGQLLFHPRAFGGSNQATSFTVKATKGAQTITQTFEANQEGIWTLKLPEAMSKPAAKIDVLFVLDATGSMGGEIERLQSTIRTMAGRIQALPHQPTVRYGLVAYRDQGEEYVTKKADFTSDVEAFKTALAQIAAEGGGDKPEDVEAALAVGLNQVSWSDDDTVRLAFLVADAAPHIDYPQSTPYTTSMKRAAEKGVKLFPIGCSGLEPEGEFAFRQMAQYTMGQYLFITRNGDESSGGGGTASATVDKFEEGRLDDIVVDIVKAELDSLGK